MGRWSQRLAPLFVEWAGVTGGERILDVGCGTGNLTLALAEAGVAAATGLDASEPYLDFARARTTDPAVTFDLGDAYKLPYADGAFDRTLSMRCCRPSSSEQERCPGSEPRSLRSPLSGFLVRFGPPLTSRQSGYAAEQFGPGSGPVRRQLLVVAGPVPESRPRRRLPSSSGWQGFQGRALRAGAILGHPICWHLSSSLRHDARGQQPGLAVLAPACCTAKFDVDGGLSSDR